MWTPVFALIVVGAYFVGAIPFGLLVGRWAGVDVRDAGSGNIGATNVARTAGKMLGGFTLLLDALKGALGPLVAAWGFAAPVEVQVTAGLAAVIGHVFPIYLRFRGGKGVATGAGVFFAITPWAALVAVGTFALVFAVARVVSIGSLAATVALAVAAWHIDQRPPVIALAFGVLVVIFVRHTGNLRRLWHGREPGL